MDLFAVKIILKLIEHLLILNLQCIIYNTITTFCQYNFVNGVHIGPLILDTFSGTANK